MEEKRLREGQRPKFILSGRLYGRSSGIASRYLLRRFPLPVDDVGRSTQVVPA